MTPRPRATIVAEPRPPARQERTPPFNLPLQRFRMTLRRVLLIGDEQTLVNILSSCVTSVPPQPPCSPEQESDLAGAPEGLPDLVVLNLAPGVDGRVLAKFLETNDPDRATSALNLAGQNASPRISRPTQLTELSQRSSGHRPASTSSPSAPRDEERPRSRARRHPAHRGGGRPGAA